MMQFWTITVLLITCAGFTFYSFMAFSIAALTPRWNPRLRIRFATIGIALALGALLCAGLVISLF